MIRSAARLPSNRDRSRTPSRGIPCARCHRAITAAERADERDLNDCLDRPSSATRCGNGRSPASIALVVFAALLFVRRRRAFAIQAAARDAARPRSSSCRSRSRVARRFCSCLLQPCSRACRRSRCRRSLQRFALTIFTIAAFWQIGLWATTAVIAVARTAAQPRSRASIARPSARSASSASSRASRSGRFVAAADARQPRHRDQTAARRPGHRRHRGRARRAERARRPVRIAVDHARPAVRRRRRAGGRRLLRHGRVHRREEHAPAQHRRASRSSCRTRTC